ncbi:MAG: hypothetical protein GX556_16050 [Fibrobacter sp.]|nr:hypothetical protein [Fibrobacter sp.]
MSSKIELLRNQVQTKQAEANKKNTEIQTARSELNKKKSEIERLKNRLGQLPANAKAEEYATRKQLQTLQSEADALEFENILRMEAERDSLQAEVKTAQNTYDLAKGEIVAQSLREEIRRYNQLLMDTAECQKKILSIFYTIPHRIRSTMGREDALKIPRLRMADVIFTQPEFKDQEPVRLFSMREWAIELTGLGESLFNPGELEFHEPKEW